MVKKVTAKKIANLVRNTHGSPRVECAKALEGNSCSFGLHSFSSTHTKLFNFLSKNSDFCKKIAEFAGNIGIFAGFLSRRVSVPSIMEAAA
jgi:hypothetical protein